MNGRHFLGWVEKRHRIMTAQREGIEIAKIQGKCREGTIRYQARANEKDKVIYDRIVHLLESVMNVIDIHHEVGIARNTIYKIQRELL